MSKFDQRISKHMKECNTEGLKRILVRDYPGAKTLREALEREIKKRSMNPTPPEIPSIDHAEQMGNIYKRVQEFIGNDYELIPNEQRENISKMPVNNIDEVKKWGNALFQAIKQARSSAPQQVPGEAD